MDAPKLARKLVIDANELYLESIEGNSFLTGNASVDETDGAPSQMDAIQQADEQFCKAFDEVERIRSRIIQRASISNSPATHLPVINATVGNSYTINTSSHTVSGGIGADTSDTHIISPKSMRINSSRGFATSSDQPQHVVKKFDKPLLSRKGSGGGGSSSRLLLRPQGGVSEGDASVHDSVTDAIGNLIEGSRPSSERRGDTTGLLNLSGDSNSSGARFEDPFLRPTEDQRRSAATRAEDSTRMAVAQRELLKVKNSLAVERKTNKPKHGGETPDGTKQAMDRFQRDNDSDSDAESAAKIAAEPAPSRRYSSSHPADLNISLSNREPLPAVAQPPPSSHRASVGAGVNGGGGSTPSSVSSAARMQMNAKLLLLSSPMNDWIHLGQSLSEDEGGGGEGRNGRRGAATGRHAPLSQQHPTIYEEQDNKHRHHGTKFSFDEALAPSPTRTSKVSSGLTDESPSTKRRSRQPQSTRSSGPQSSRESRPRHSPSPSGLGGGGDSSVDILKSYTDQTVVDNVRKALLHLNGLMDASEEGVSGKARGEEENMKAAPISAEKDKSEAGGERPRRLSKDVSQSYSADSSVPPALRGPFKTSSSSSALLSDGVSLSAKSKREHSSKRAHELAEDLSPRKSSTNPPLRSPQTASSDSHSSPAGSTHKRLSALAAALDAGDAVGKLMAEMLVSKKK
eukprot:gene25161-31585_t